MYLDKAYLKPDREDSKLEGKALRMGFFSTGSIRARMGPFPSHNIRVRMEPNPDVIRVYFGFQYRLEDGKY